MEKSEIEKIIKTIEANRELVKEIMCLVEETREVLRDKDSRMLSRAEL